uniref:Uncharacterized protein n=1 Tax=Arundo donax TaxID=35708 RepID=A0A0A8ZTE4_ARUDO
MCRRHHSCQAHAHPRAPRRLQVTRVAPRVHSDQHDAAWAVSTAREGLLLPNGSASTASVWEGEVVGAQR